MVNQEASSRRAPRGIGKARARERGFGEEELRGLEARRARVEEEIASLEVDERMAPYLADFHNELASPLASLDAVIDSLRSESDWEKRGVLSATFDGAVAKIRWIVKNYIERCEQDQKAAMPVSEEEVVLSSEGDKLLGQMKAEFADLPNPFTKIEAGEPFGYDKKQADARDWVAKIAKSVLAAEAGGLKISELEAVIGTMTDELLDKGEAYAAYYLVKDLKRGRDRLNVVLDEERLIEARKTLFNRGEVACPVSNTESDFELISGRLKDMALDKDASTPKSRERVDAEITKRFFSPKEVEEVYGRCLRENRIWQCLAMLKYVKRINALNADSPIYPKDTLSFEANPRLKSAFLDAYKERFAELKTAKDNGTLTPPLDTTDGRAVRERLRPHSDLAIANGMLEFDWKDLCQKLGVN